VICRLVLIFEAKRWDLAAITRTPLLPVLAPLFMRNP